MKSSYQNKALAVQAKAGNYLAVIRLVERGAPINARNSIALKFAAFKGHSKIIRFLIECGADYHFQNEFILRSAVRHNDVEMVLYLLRKGDVDVHAKPSASMSELVGASAIESAKLRGHNEILNLLELYDKEKNAKKA